MGKIRTGNVGGIKFDKMYLFVVRPKDPMKSVYRKTVPAIGVEIVKSMLDKNGDRYFYNEIKIN